MKKTKQTQTTPEVRLYAFRRKIDGLIYEGEIPATSFEEAGMLAKKLGCELDGRLNKK